MASRTAYACHWPYFMHSRWATLAVALHDGHVSATVPPYHRQTKYRASTYTSRAHNHASPNLHRSTNFPYAYAMSPKSLINLGLQERVRSAQDPPSRSPMLCINTKRPSRSMFEDQTARLGCDGMKPALLSGPRHNARKNVSTPSCHVRQEQ